MPTTFLGLDDLRIFGFKRKGAIPLYCEELVEQTLRRQFFYAFDEQEQASPHSTPQLEFRRIGTRAVLSVRIDRPTPFRVWHGTTPVLAYRLNDVAFVTDCKMIPDESWPLLEGLDTLIVDALWDEVHPTHFNVEEALAVIEQVKPRRAYFTHISHRLEYEATNARLPDGVELSYDGLKIDLIVAITLRVMSARGLGVECSRGSTRNPCALVTRSVTATMWA